MSAINLTEVDFNQIKTNLIDYLKSTDQFTDYDFDGSNLQVILNLIAYQAQLNAYSTNMIANESFLSSATLRNNVVANARSIGYLPSSAKSSFLTTDFTFQLNSSNYPAGFPRTLQLQPGMVLGTRNSTSNVVFNSIDTVNAAVSNSGSCTFSEITVYEGTYITTTFTRDTSEYNQRFILGNSEIDTSTIRIEVQENPVQEDTERYTQATNIVTLTSESRVFWVEEIDDQQYELTFGDGYFGKKLENGAVITVTYLVTHGPESNGITGVSNFNFVGNVIDSNGTKITTQPTLSSVGRSEGGSLIENTSSVKFRAPRDYASQNRCVIAEDYETLIREIYPAVDDIYVFGGETLDTPQYGRVYVVIKPIGTGKLTNASRTYIKNSLDDFRVASLDIVILDADILNVEVVSTVHYDETSTSKDGAAITSEVREVLENYGESSTVSKFGGAVRFSSVVASIDDADNSITRNNTELRMRKDLKALLNTAASYEVCFLNEFDNIPDSGISSVYSSGFTVSGDTKTYYFEDDSKGKLYRFYIDDTNQKQIVDASFGTVDYEKGEVIFGSENSVTFTSTVVSDSIVEVRAIPKKQDVFAKDTIYINLDVNKSDIISVVDTEIAGS